MNNRAGRKAVKWLRRALGLREDQPLAWVAVEVCTVEPLASGFLSVATDIRAVMQADIDPEAGTVAKRCDVPPTGTLGDGKALPVKNQFGVVGGVPLVTPPGTTVTSVTPDVTGREAMKDACATVIDVLDRCKASGGAMSYGSLQDCVTDLTRCGYTEEEARGLVARAMPVFPEKPAESQERRGYEFL